MQQITHRTEISRRKHQVGERNTQNLYIIAQGKILNFEIACDSRTDVHKSATNRKWVLPVTIRDEWRRAWSK